MRAFVWLVLCLLACKPSQPVALSAAMVHERLSPSIAYISADATSGSGVLLDGRLVLTNAHVVWPHERVRVVFSPTLEFLDVPVQGLDLDADLALVGPLPESLDRPALRLESPDALPIGTEVFLVGYPGEVERFPQPAITRGVLSRVREARFENLTFLQSDATIVGGQSGGALVSPNGTVVGISGLSGIERFALALSSSDVLARLAGITQSPSPVARSLKRTPASNSFSVSFTPSRAQAAWFVDADEGESVLVESEDAALDVFDANLEEAALAADDRFHFEVNGPHTVIAQRGSEELANVKSDRPLLRFEDPDDGVAVTIGQMVHGVIDHPGDEDRYQLTLEAGQAVYVRVDGVFEALCSIYDENGDDELVGARVAEGGLGMSADLFFEAERACTYIINIADGAVEGPAGYALHVSEAKERPRRVRNTPDGGTHKR